MVNINKLAETEIISLRQLFCIHGTGIGIKVIQYQNTPSESTPEYLNSRLSVIGLRSLTIERLMIQGAQSNGS